MSQGVTRPPGDEAHAEESGSRAWYRTPAIVVPAVVAILGAVIAAAVALYTHAHPESPHAPLAVRVDPATASADETTSIKVSGTGFTADHGVRVEIANFSEEAPVNGGSFVTGFTVPAGSLLARTYVVVVTGLDSGQEMDGALTLQ